MPCIHCDATGKRQLPPDPEGMNDDRAEWAHEAIIGFMKRTGTDFQDSLGDLLCDLMHWSDRAGFDFQIALDRAHAHYTEETGGMPWQQAEVAQ
jgi:hypothetical protein